jgi:hypothetical protein
MDFRLKDGEQVRTRIATIASATVIEPGDFVELSSGVPVKATATGAKIAWAPNGSADGETEIELSVGNDFTLVGTADTNFVAATHNGAEVDLVVNSNAQQIDLGSSSTDVLLVSPFKDAGTASSAANVEVRINKPLF